MIRKVMDAIYQSVGGLDVHQETVVSCRRRLISHGQAELEIQTFKTTSADLRELAKWLAEWQVTHVAMESTGIYWVPVWNILEGQFQLVLANPQQLKKAPGRKDDQIDAEWTADGGSAMASPDAAAGEADRSADERHQSHPQRVGAGQHQALECRLGYYGGERSGHDQGAESGRE
jgi:hypothetical protein